MESRVLMSQKQLNRYVVIDKSLEGTISVKEAAEILSMSTRQVIRLRNGVREQGASALVHKNQGRKPAHALEARIKEEIVALKSSEKYREANFNHYQELLAKHEKIQVSYALLYQLLTKAGIQSPKKRRRLKKHHRRKRKAQEGLLVQIDASPFAWLGGKKKYALHGAIDDATGKVLGLYLTKNECLQGYFETTRQVVDGFGIPLSYYSDRHSIFLSHQKDKLTVEEQLQGKVCNDTQFGRAMNELGINIIPARSPQAKGRIERLWETLQSRLPVEFKIAEINTLEEANRFLQEGYLDEFNGLFAVKAADERIAYRSAESIDLSRSLCVKEKRKVDAGGVFSFYGKHFMVIAENNQPPIPTRAQITVCISNITGIKVEYKDNLYQTIDFIKPKKLKKQSVKKEPRKYIPPNTHYYKQGQNIFPKLSFEESNQEVLEMLNDVFFRNYARLS
jgi:transposase